MLRDGRRLTGGPGTRKPAPDRRHAGVQVPASLDGHPLLTPSCSPRSRSRCSQTTAYSLQVPGTPLRSCSPRSSNENPEPATRSLTVLDTSTSPGAARDEIRDPSRPRYLRSSRRRVALAGMDPARTARSCSFAPSTMARAHAIARAGPSKRQKNPSPAVSTSSPRKRASSRRTSAW